MDKGYEVDQPEGFPELVKGPPRLIREPGGSELDVQAGEADGSQPGVAVPVPIPVTPPVPGTPPTAVPVPGTPPTAVQGESVVKSAPAVNTEPARRSTRSHRVPQRLIEQY